MTPINRNFKFLIFLLACTLPLGAHAASADRKLPLEVEADQKHSDYQSGQAVYQGNVIVRQGRMLTRADKATITLKNGQLERIQLEGKPVTYQDVDEQGLPLAGEALHVDYQVNPKTGDVLILTGKAKIDRNRDVLESERITYNLKTEVMDAGGGKGERVRMILQPRESTDGKTKP